MTSGNDQELQAALNKALTLVKAKNDTSRFVGLSLMRNLLDNHEVLRKDTKTVARCQEAISVKFLRRLLLSRSSEKRSEEEAKGMRHLAIAIIHSFGTVLGTGSSGFGADRIIMLFEPLLQDLQIVDLEYQDLIWQILYGVTGSYEAVKIMIVPDSLNYIIVTPSTPDMINAQRLGRLLSLSWLTVAKAHISGSSIWDMAVEYLITKHSNANPAFVLEVAAIALGPIVLTSQPAWLDQLISVCRSCISSRPTSQTRRAVITIYATLIRKSHASLHIAGRLFDKESSFTDFRPPFTYIFINLLLIDIRTTIPSLMERLASPDYTETSFRLSECYDILTAFIAWLLQMMAQADEDIVEGQALSGLMMSADQLLKIRRDCKETFSLTLEYLRDRWDAAVTGAKGLDPATYDIVRPPEISSQPLALTWDNPIISPRKDPIVLAGLRSIALWTREDEDDELQEQVLGIFDMLLALLKDSPEFKNETEGVAAVDFRSTVLMLLSTILSAHEAAVQQFLELDAWSTVSGIGIPALHEGQPFTQDALQCLISVVESPLVPQSRQAWMSAVTQISRILGSDLTSINIEDQASACQLCVSLLKKAAVRVRALFKEECRALDSRMRQLSVEVKDEDLRAELMTMLADLEDMT